MTTDTTTENKMMKMEAVTAIKERLIGIKNSRNTGARRMPTVVRTKRRPAKAFKRDAE